MSGLKPVFQKMRDTSTEILELATIKTFGVVYGESLTADRERERENAIFECAAPTLYHPVPKVTGFKMGFRTREHFLG